MKPAQFAYRAPESLEEALQLKSEHAGDCAVLAGGQSLVPMLNLRLALPEVVIDLRCVRELVGIEARDGGVAIGAMTRQRDAERSQLAWERHPLLRRALAFVGHPAIRNRGTVGGSVAHADPAAELPAAMLVLDAELVVHSTRGERVVPAAAFFHGYMATALEPDELLIELRLPAPPPRAGSAVVETARRHGDFALAGAAALVALDDRGAIADARVAVLGAHGTAVRRPEVERQLVGVRPDERFLREAAETAVADLDPPSDGHGSGAYRRRIAAVMIRRALQAAIHEGETA